jgi:glycosyltransferase involved in cell wall biosynthesis
LTIHLKTLYNSLESQTFKEFEWLIVDDGSIDDTGQIVKIMRRNAHIVILRGGLSEQEGLLFRWRKVSHGTHDLQARVGSDDRS